MFSGSKTLRKNRKKLWLLCITYSNAGSARNPGVESTEQVPRLEAQAARAIGNGTVLPSWDAGEEHRPSGAFRGRSASHLDARCREVGLHVADRNLATVENARCKGSLHTRLSKHLGEVLHTPGAA